MIVTIFGATGGIGRLVVERALEQGHEVRAYVRNPGKVTINHERLTVIDGQLNDYPNVRKAIEGSQAVIDAIGVPVQRHYDSADALNGARAIILAMQETGVRRLVAWSTPTVRKPTDKRAFGLVAGRWVIRTFFKQTAAELHAIVDAIEKSGLDWTVVRFGPLGDSPDDRELRAGDGDGYSPEKVARSQIAGFMVRELSENRWVRQLPIVHNDN
ncbi:NAD(P)-dependent oxidoreductase [Paractinoplanes atraurantiacus]|uniref:NAD(P)H-binding n=1 Tax=Paractinoplanes atraurantiacus TaxID=1036182 RepID=A0A285H713_9ACTN|nr:NAD(P)H-binding protein [Actinoplanes atraurantiacus]SNY31404.1 NAD(P)H-binding [Actinoplanes atraurantiacus]